MNKEREGAIYQRHYASKKGKIFSNCKKEPLVPRRRSAGHVSDRAGTRNDDDDEGKDDSAEKRDLKFF